MYEKTKGEAFYDFLARHGYVGKQRRHPDDMMFARRSHVASVSFVDSGGGGKRRFMRFLSFFDTRETKAGPNSRQRLQMNETKP